MATAERAQPVGRNKTIDGAVSASGCERTPCTKVKAQAYERADIEADTELEVVAPRLTRGQTQTGPP